MALLLGSVAIDAGNNAFTPSAYDQRGPGFPRVFGAKIDIGAVEYQSDRIFANGFEPGPYPSQPSPGAESRPCGRREIDREIGVPVVPAYSTIF